MTESDAMTPVDDRFIDHIVDGELTPAELRAVIDRLDHDPAGWKRCALAFMEAQCWRESFRATVQAAPERTSRTGARKLWIQGSIAAGIVAASFAMGWMGHSARPWSAATSVTGSQPSRQSETAGDPGPPARFASSTSGDGQTPPNTPHVVRAVAVGRVRLGNQSDGAEVPLLAGPGINEQWLRNQPPPITEHSQVALQRSGYQVDQSRRLVTTTLPDGRRVTIPIDQVQIRYTGNNPL